MAPRTNALRRTAFAALGLLILAGCTGDPVEDSPAGASAPTVDDADAGADIGAGGPTDFGPGGHAAPQAGTTDPVDAPGNGAADVTADGATHGAVPASPAASPGVPSSPALPTAPDAVDCAGTLPCALRAPDGAFEIVLSAADGDGSDGSGAPRVDFAVAALTRDVALGIDLASSLIADGEVAVGASARFGAGVAGAVPGAGSNAAPTMPTVAGDDPIDDVARAPVSNVASHALLPGLPINGRVTFADTRATAPRTIDRLTLVVHEAGTRTGLAFANVPWGPAGGDPVDCALALPCTWSAPGGEVTLTVEAVGLDRWHNATRTIVDWRADAPRELTLALADAASATTDEGDPLEHYGIDFGGATSRDEGPLDDVAGPGAPATGRTAFRRAPPEGAAALATLELDLAERRAPRVPRWHIVLTNLPLSR